jgi:hypothetical protein
MTTTHDGRFPNPRNQELAVLIDGPYAGFWYWRDDLEIAIAAAQDAPRRSHRAEAAAKAKYRPTERFRRNPERPAEQGREWSMAGGSNG